MRILVVCCFLFSAAACSKHNPAVCCNTPTQCSSFGLDGVIGCDTGKVCDSSGACVSPQCASSAECADPMAYCSSEGLCVATCVADSECPGGGQGSDQIHCSNGACVQCATAADCPASAPVCSAAQTCAACVLDADCASQACNTDGTCVDPSMIAYVSTTGMDTADCSQATPCSLTHGISIGRSYTVVGSGAYQLTALLTITGSRVVVGVNKPTITRTTTGTIISIGPGSTVQLTNLEITGATNTSNTSGDGIAIDCPNDQTQRKLGLTNVKVTANASTGVNGMSCGVNALRSEFSFNTGFGLYVKDNSASVDRCNFANNRSGFVFDGNPGVIVSNSFFSTNSDHGLDVNSDGPGYAEFNTFAENNVAIRMGGPPNYDLTNNLLAGNYGTAVDCEGSGCNTNGSIILADVTTAKFKVPHVDFHITAGSVAIDAAAASTMDHDYDGDMRPLGSGRDVGADEAQ